MLRSLQSIVGLKQAKVNERFALWLVNQPRRYKRAIVALHDAVLIFIALLSSFGLRLGEVYWPTTTKNWILTLAAPLIGFFSLWFAGAYRRIIRYTGRTGAKRVLTGLFLTVLLWTLLILTFSLDGRFAYFGMPRSVPILFLALSFLFVWASREVVSAYFGHFLAQSDLAALHRENVQRRKVLIWGYSDTAVQLAHSLRAFTSYDTIGIVDEDPSLHFLKADDIRIFPPEYLDVLIPKEGIGEIFLNNKVLGRESQQRIVQRLEKQSVRFKVLPSVDDIAAGAVTIHQIRPIMVEDLLGRDPVPPIDDLLAGSVRGKSVMVTGAGGSIGGELVRQLARLGARKIVLFELSEAALYTIHSQLLRMLPEVCGEGNSCPELHAAIGSVLDATAVRHEIRRHGVQTIYHAAAYKHVPLVEENPVVGIRNNTMGTQVIAEAAVEEGVERLS